MTCYVLEPPGGRHVAVPSVFPRSHQCTLAQHNRPQPRLPASICSSRYRDLKTLILKLDLLRLRGQSNADGEFLLALRRMAKRLTPGRNRWAAIVGPEPADPPGAK
jgi:hypothetical protein